VADLLGVILCINYFNIRPFYFIAIIVGNSNKNMDVTTVIFAIVT